MLVVEGFEASVGGGRYDDTVDAGDFARLPPVSRSSALFWCCDAAAGSCEGCSAPLDALEKAESRPRVKGCESKDLAVCKLGCGGRGRVVGCDLTEGLEGIGVRSDSGLCTSTRGVLGVGVCRSGAGA